MSALDIRLGAGDVDLDAVHGFLSTQANWALGMPRARMARAVANSLNYSGYADGAQVAYARVISDETTFAWLADVFVLPAHCGRGYADRLVEAVVADPRLQGLRRLMLATSTAAPLYARHGFATAPALPEIMVRHTLREGPPPAR